MMTTTLRDRALGRIAVAQHFVNEIRDSLDAAIAHFVVTDEDQKGKERQSLLEEAEYGAHMIAIAVGEAMVAFNDMERDLIEEGESLGEDDDEGPAEDDDEDE